MKLKDTRNNVTAPAEVTEAMFTIGHWLANTGPDLDTSFNVTEGDEVVTFVLQMKEIRRYPWLIDGEASHNPQDKSDR